MSEHVPELYPSREIAGELSPILPTAIDPDAVVVLRRLQQARHRAYLVGGCVRDLLLGGTPKDFDIATSARPRQVKKLFRNARIVGRRFRLVHVMFGPRKQIEVSTFRRDPGEAGGDDEPFRPDSADSPDSIEERDAPLSADGEVAAPENGGDDEEEQDLLIREDNVYGSEAEDARRRDFTINGLFYDVESEQVLDYVGGVADLRRRVLRTIGDPSRRVREDPVRILRAVKFSTRLKLDLDPLLSAAMAEHHADLRKSAPPRVFEEILRILSGAKPERSIEMLAKLGVVQLLFPELGISPPGDADDARLKRVLARLGALAEIDRGQRSLPTATYLAALFHDELVRRLVGEAADGGRPPPSQALDDFLRPIGQRCRMARRDTARVRAMYLALRRIDPEFADPHGRKRRRRGGLAEFVAREFFEDALLLMRIVATAEGRDLAAVLEWERRRDETLASRRDGPRHDGPRPPRHHPSHAPREAPRSDDAAPEERANASGSRRRRRRRRGRSAPSVPAEPPAHDDPMGF